MLLILMATSMVSFSAPLLLKPGEIVKGHVKDAMPITYLIAAKAGQLLVISPMLAASAMDAILLDPQKAVVRRLVTDDASIDRYKPIYFVVRRSGLYTVRISRGSKYWAEFGLRVDTPHVPNAMERHLAQGDELSFRGDQIRTGQPNRDREALAFYLHALDVMKEEAFAPNTDSVLLRIALVEQNLEDFDKALEYLQELLRLDERTGDKIGEIAALDSIGSIETLLGRTSEARDILRRALSSAQSIGDKRLELETLNTLSQTADTTTYFQASLFYEKQALELTRQIKEKVDCGCEPSLLLGLGITYEALHEYDRSLSYLKEGLAKVKPNSTIASAFFNHFGRDYFQLGNSTKALYYYKKALTISTATHYRSGEAAQRFNLASLYFQKGQNRSAEYHFVRSLRIYDELARLPDQGRVLGALGELYTRTNRIPDAEHSLIEALSRIRHTGDRIGEAYLLEGLARLFEKRGNIEKALALSEEAIESVEAVRTSIVSQFTRASFLSGVSSLYEYRVGLLMKIARERPGQGFEIKALECSEQGRARALLDELSLRNVDIREGVDPVLLKRERSLLELLTTMQAQQLRSQTSNLSGSGAVPGMLAVIAELRDVEDQIRARSPQYAALHFPAPLKADQIQRLIDDKTLLIEYSLGDDCSFLWVVSQTEVKAFELPKRTVVETTAQKLSDFLKAPEGSFGVNNKLKLTALCLGQMLLGPIEDALRGKRLLIVADGALQYIPFSAIELPNVVNSVYMPMITESEITMLPSASVISLLRPQSVEQSKTQLAATLVIADPVFRQEDERVKFENASRGSRDRITRQTVTKLTGRISTEPIDDSLINRGIQLSRLPFTRQEAQSIRSLAGDANVKTLLDFDASRRILDDLDLSQYSILHFATHGIANAAHPDLSGLVLSLFDPTGEPQPGFLSLADIYNLNLNARLVVLSACQTGIGRDFRGEGIVGLTRGFMYAGASSVLVSLWGVNDVGTAELMKRFYEFLFLKGERPPAALRDAQLSMWREARWQSPHYWSAFTLQGDWH
jgi:CHAT domain-containing protein/tetratricopeptide (TPR) repeat protein